MLSSQPSEQIGTQKGNNVVEESEEISFRWHFVVRGGNWLVLLIHVLTKLGTLGLTPSAVQDEISILS